MKTIAVSIVVFGLLVFFFAPLDQGGSQDPLPPPSEGCNGVGNPHCDEVPLTGLEWLALAGGGLAIKKLKDRKTNG
jgi:hypothetical protein